MPASNSNIRTTGEPLSRELILSKALELANQDGFENLSMRKLAGALGKTAMALYRHFDSIDEIKAYAVALAFTEVDTTPIPGERWDDTLRRTTSSIRKMEKKYYRAHFYQVRSTAWGPALKEHTNRIQNLHHNQGIPEEVLAVLWRIIDAFLTGFIINESAEFEYGIPRPTADEPEWMPTVENAYTDKAFNDGMDIIIAGIYRLAAPDPCEWHTPEE